MHSQPYPTHSHPEPALHLLGGIWIASCPTCGWQLTTARTQQRCECRAARRLASEPGYLRHARTLERLSAELAEVLTRLIAADRGQAKDPAP